MGICCVNSSINSKWPYSSTVNRNEGRSNWIKGTYRGIHSAYPHWVSGPTLVQLTTLSNRISADNMEIQTGLPRFCARHPVCWLQQLTWIASFLSFSFFVNWVSVALIIWHKTLSLNSQKEVSKNDKEMITSFWMDWEYAIGLSNNWLKYIFVWALHLSKYI